MSDFDALLLADALLAVLLSAGVWRGHAAVQLRRKPQPRQQPAEPPMPRPRSLRKDSQP